MKEIAKNWGDQWVAAQQAMWKAFVPQAPAQTGSGRPAPGANAMEEQFNELRDIWQTSSAKWSDFAKNAAQGEVPSPDKLREMFTPSSWTGPGSGVLDAGLQRMLEGPRYATLWDLDRKLLELQQLTLARDKDVGAYQAVVQKAWNLAFVRFTKAVAAEPSGPLAWRTLTDKWLAVANDTLIEVHRSDEFVEAQRRMLRSASDRHLQERKIAEAWCEAAHVPTRTEVDELQRLVVELRRDVRRLRRAASPMPSIEPAPARPARKTASRPRSAARKA
ncbi:poly(R)-hydroxyalkanoic acid synthase subunit PhaE [Ideonella sp. YS5]|uniref:poly(R)-hydroxyalkanoic acid synthase subunit PhaE n=1 Tax=Ideonella sp. YS5 TaxID=3453714 RepID=UPI003EE9DB4D